MFLIADGTARTVTFHKEDCGSRKTAVRTPIVVTRENLQESLSDLVKVRVKDLTPAYVYDIALSDSQARTFAGILCGVLDLRRRGGGEWSAVDCGNCGGSDRAK